MNLFQAATTGVDPQTGSYLSKIQRVAMFRKSIGMSGTSGGASESGSSFVKPQSGIVVRNKMTEVVEKLQVNTFQAIENVDTKVEANKKDISALVVTTENKQDKDESDERREYVTPQTALVKSNNTDIVEQLQTNYQDGIERVIVRVEENKENIEDLSGVYAADSKYEAKEEKLQTRSVIRERQRALRALREKLVEGIGSALGKVQSGLKNIGAKIKKTADSFLKKLLEFFGLLGLAWLVENYEDLKKAVGRLTLDFEQFKTDFLAAIGKAKGVWSLIDVVLRQIWKRTSGLVRTVYRAARWIAKSVVGLVSKIFRAIGRGLGRIKGLFTKPKVSPPSRGPSSSAGDAVGGAKDGARGAAGATDAAGDATKAKPKGVFGSIKDFVKNTVDNINPLKKAQEASGGANKPAARDGWMKKAFKPLTDRFPGIKISPLIKKLANLPFIGSIVDIAINRGIDGESWMYSIISGLISGGIGGLGAVKGAALGKGVGAVAGTLLIPIPGVGTVAGGILGAGIGGLLGGWLAGSLAELGVDSAAAAAGIDKSAKGGDVVTTKLKDGFSAMGNAASSILSPNSTASPTSGPSTPDGMGLPTTSAGGNVTNVDLGTEFIDATQPKAEPPIDSAKNYNDVNPVPLIKSSDSETDMYRAFSLKTYDLVY